MKRIKNTMERFKAFLHKCANNSSYTLSSDIKELFASYVLSVGYYMLHIFHQRDEIKKTKKLKNTKKGKNCFIFANGPSMNLLDINKIEKYQKAGFDVICVNTYILSDMANTVVPNYYVLSDPGSFGISKENISESVQNANKKVIDRINVLNIPVFIPAHFSNLKLFKNYYRFNDYENRFMRNIDPTKPRGYRGMTAYKALAIACHLGYETIYICGFDNDYFKTITVDKNNDIYYDNKHYYDMNDTGTLCKIGPNIPPYWIQNVGNLLWVYSLLFETLKLFNKYNIINLYENSLVDIFPKTHDLDVYFN